AAFTEETAENVRLALENIQQVSTQVTRMFGAQETTLADLSASLQATTETLGQAAEAVRRASGHIEAAISGGELKAIVGNAERTTAQLDSFATALLAATRDLESVLARADSASRAVTFAMGAAGEGQGTLGRLLQDTTLYADLVRTNTLIQQLRADFQANPRKYINLKIFGAGSAAARDPLPGSCSIANRWRSSSRSTVARRWVARSGSGRWRHGWRRSAAAAAM